VGREWQARKWVVVRFDALVVLTAYLAPLMLRFQGDSNRLLVDLHGTDAMDRRGVHLRQSLAGTYSSWSIDKASGVMPAQMPKSFGPDSSG
jgi:hypothetical protein